MRLLTRDHGVRVYVKDVKRHTKIRTDHTHTRYFPKTLWPGDLESVINQPTFITSSSAFEETNLRKIF